MKTIFAYIKPKLARISFGLVIKLTGTIVELLLPWMLSVILDRYVPTKNKPMIFTWGAMMVICSVICFAANVLANRMSTSVSRDITQKIRRDLFGKITFLSCSQADSFTVPSLISRLTSDTYNLHEMIDRMQRLGVRAPILLIGGIVVSMTLDPILTLVLIVILPILALIIFLVTGKGIKMYTTAQSKLDKLVRRAQESMSGIRVIEALSKQTFERAQFDTANHDVVKCERSASLLMNVTSPVMNLLLNVGLAAVIVVGAYRVNGGDVTSGTLIAFLSYFTIILNALMMVSRMFMICSKGTASGKRIAEVLETPSARKVLPIKKTESENCIEFRNVTFSYDKVHPNVENISFSLKHGETLGIIGTTGSGKSTILKLLLRFYDTDSGSIYINGKDIRSIEKHELHSIFGIAMQNDFLFSGSIYDNIDFERGLSKEDILAASKTAQAEFIEKRQGGFDGAIASKGQDLSGGQKQRLLLSRALAGKPEILLLDDSSSALDYKTDASLRRALAQNHSESAKIIVAQRVSSIKNADKILYLDSGRVLGCGTHDYLMKTCENYREIAEVQMGDVG